METKAPHHICYHRRVEGYSGLTMVLR